MCGEKNIIIIFLTYHWGEGSTWFFSSLSISLWNRFFVVKELFMWMDECNKKKTDGEETAAKVIAVDEEIYTK